MATLGSNEKRLLVSQTRNGVAMYRSITCIISIGLITVVFTAVAQAQPPTTQAGLATTSPVDEGGFSNASIDPLRAVSDQLRSDDAKAIEPAIAQIRALLQSNPQKSLAPLRGNWLIRLMTLQRYDDVSDLSQRAILISPSETSGVEQLQTFRVHALLSEGKATEALAAAKQLFDVCTLKGTADAVRTICQCLNAVHPDDRDVLKKYRKEQIDGAAPTSSVPEQNSGLTLANIRVDPAPYQAAIRAVTAEDYKTLVGEGNLMLLAGDSKGAWDVFERAYTMALDRDLVAASENLARCMKAQDGTIGRANAWVLSIRPKEQLASERSMATASTQMTHKE